MKRAATRRIALAMGLAGLMHASVASTAGPASEEADRPLDLEVEGAWTHPSGMVFAERAAGFARVSVSQFPGGEDGHGAAYELAEGREKLASVTVRVYPSPGLGLDERFERVVADVADEHRSPPSIRGTVAVAQQGAMANGRAASWAYRAAFGRREQDVESRALLFVRGRWFVEYRITYPAAARGRVEAEIDDLLRALVMPPG